MTDSALPSRLERYSKENPWYYKDLTNHLAPISRKLLEEYSHIPPEDVDAHVYKLVRLHSSLTHLNRLTRVSSVMSSGPKPPTLASASSNSSL
jgi:hypothetical protein